MNRYCQIVLQLNLGIGIYNHHFTPFILHYPAYNCFSLANFLGLSVGVCSICAVYSTCFHFESTDVFMYQYYVDCPFILVYILFFILLCFLDFYHYHITIVLKIKKYKNIPAVDTIYVFKYHSKPCFLC